MHCESHFAFYANYCLRNELHISLSTRISRRIVVPIQRSADTCAIVKTLGHGHDWQRHTYIVPTYTIWLEKATTTAVCEVTDVRYLCGVLRSHSFFL